MRVLYFSRSFIPSHHANSIHVMNMCEALTELGHEVLLICPKHESATADEIFHFYGTKSRFTIIQINWSKLPGKAFLYALAASRVLKSFSPDLVISRFLYGSLLSTSFSFKTIHDLHDKDWESGRISRIVFNRLINHKNLVKLTFNSNGLLNLFKQAFHERLGLSLQVLFNGAKALPLTDTVKLPGRNEFKAGYFGNLYQGRGIELILEVAKRLPFIDFIIVGGTQHDIDLWRTKNIPENIFFMGFIDPKEVYKFRNSVNVLLAPYAHKVAMAGNTGNSAEYMNPIKIFEYMSSGKLIVSSDLPAIREVLSEKNAVLSEYTVESWTRALEDICKNFEDYRMRAEFAIKQFEQSFSWKARAQGMLS